MVQLGIKLNSLTENYEAIRTILHASSPADLNRRRDEAIALFRGVGISTTRDEEFKYLPLRELQDNSYGHALGATVVRSEVEKTLLGKVDGITLRFVNGEFAPELSNELGLPAGVSVGSMRDRFEAEQRLDRLGSIAPLTGKLGSTNDERYAWLNEANFADGAFVHIKKGVIVERPIFIEFVHSVEAPMAIYPRVLLELQEGAQAKVIESYVGLNGNAIAGESFVCALTEVIVGKDAVLEHVRVQNESLQSIHIGTLAVHQEERSTYRSTNVAFGARKSRIDLNLWSAGENTESTLDGTYIGRGDQIHDIHTRIDHAKANCRSFEVYKGILSDEATGVFNGKIFVYEDAQKTDAKQTNKAILLSDRAVINSKPQLEIFADDVKCTHGATVGQLRDDAMFYLRSRGIPKQEAQGMLVYAFAAEVLDKISVKVVREALETALFSKLEE